MNDNVRLSPEQVQMVRAIANSNMVLSRAARAMHRCRQGLQYHLDKVFELTGLNPMNFYDLNKLLQLIDDVEQEKRYRYYCLVYPPAPDTLPSKRIPFECTTFGTRCYIAAIDRMALGWVDYEHELTPFEISRYGLIMQPRECEP